MQIANKVTLVTGASEGIGASCARLLEERGAKVSGLALPGHSFQDRETDRLLLTAGDITSADTRRAFVERTLEKFGRVDILINNAGVGQYGFPLEVDTEVSKQMFDVNVFSALALTQLAVPHMRAQGSGTVVNIGSVGGKVSLPWAVMYCATKWALHCVDDSLRRELAGTGVQVLKVCPGIVDTRFRDHVLGGKAPGAVEEIRRLVSPDQVAAAVARGIERNRRIVYVPRIGRIFTSMDFFAPWLMDRYLRGKF